MAETKLIPIPKQYEWVEKSVKKHDGPRMLKEFLKLYGIQEIVGKKHNQVILDWARELNIPNYKDDETAWCGLVMAVVAYRAGKKVVANPLWARNWKGFGNPADVPSLADVMVFKRGDGGHVGLYIGEDDTHYHILGGNTKNAVGIARLEKSRLIAARRLYLIGAPKNVKPYILDGKGEVSENEA